MLWLLLERLHLNLHFFNLLLKISKGYDNNNNIIMIHSYVTYTRSRIDRHANSTLVNTRTELALMFGSNNIMN